MSVHLIQGAYKLSEDFAKPYFHKFWTEIHDVTTIWMRNVCSFIVTLHAFDVRPTCDTADVQAILLFPPNPLKHVFCDVPDCGVDALSRFWLCLWKWWDFQMVVTSCISVQYLWKYGFVKSSDNVYAPRILENTRVYVKTDNLHRVFPFSICENMVL